MTNKKTRLIEQPWVPTALLTALILVVLIFAYILFAPVKIIKINDAHIITPTIHQGQAVGFTFNYCKYKSIPGTVYRFVTNTKDKSLSINLPVAATVSVPGCHVATIYAELSAGIPNGTYRLSGDNVYVYNGIRTQSYHWVTDNTFNIEN